MAKTRPYYDHESAKGDGMNYRKPHPQAIRLRRHMDGPYCLFCVPGKRARITVRTSPRMKVDRTSWKKELAA